MSVIINDFNISHLPDGSWEETTYKKQEVSGVPERTIEQAMLTKLVKEDGKWKQITIEREVHNSSLRIKSIKDGQAATRMQHEQEIQLLDSWFKNNEQIYRDIENILKAEEDKKQAAADTLNPNKTVE